MAMYPISTIPLIHCISTVGTKHVWYADDASVAGDIETLRLWWDQLTKIGPQYGYYPNTLKTRLYYVKEESFSRALSSKDCQLRRSSSWKHYKEALQRRVCKSKSRNAS